MKRSSIALLAVSSEAATSLKTSASPLGGNGHNVSFDGRLFVIRRNAGWEAIRDRWDADIATAEPLLKQRFVNAVSQLATERYRDDKKTYSNAHMMPKMIRQILRHYARGRKIAGERHYPSRPFCASPRPHSEGGPYDR